MLFALHLHVALQVRETQLALAVELQIHGGSGAVHSADVGYGVEVDPTLEMAMLGLVVFIKRQHSGRSSEVVSFRRLKREPVLGSQAYGGSIFAKENGGVARAGLPTLVGGCGDLQMAKQGLADEFRMLRVERQAFATAESVQLYRPIKNQDPVL